MQSTQACSFRPFRMPWCSLDAEVGQLQQESLPLTPSDSCRCESRHWLCEQGQELCKGFAPSATQHCGCLFGMRPPATAGLHTLRVKSRRRAFKRPPEAHPEKGLFKIQCKESLAIDALFCCTGFSASTLLTGGVPSTGFGQSLELCSRTLGL